jgi:hypothetical protein
MASQNDMLIAAGVIALGGLVYWTLKKGSAAYTAPTLPQTRYPGILPNAVDTLMRGLYTASTPSASALPPAGFVGPPTAAQVVTQRSFIGPPTPPPDPNAHLFDMPQPYDFSAGIPGTGLSGLTLPALTPTTLLLIAGIGYMLYQYRDELLA